jgi:hypothetical protein
MATMKVYVEVLPDESVPGAYLVHNDMTPNEAAWPQRLPGMAYDQGGQSGGVPMQLRRLQELECPHSPLSR